MCNITFVPRGQSNIAKCRPKIADFSNQRCCRLVSLRTRRDVPRSGCAPVVGWPLRGRDSRAAASKLTKLSQMLQMLGTGGCVLLQMSPLILPRQRCRLL